MTFRGRQFRTLDVIISFLLRQEKAGKRLILSLPASFLPIILPIFTYNSRSKEESPISAENLYYDR